jgi:hypothetical protein
MATVRSPGERGAVQNAPLAQQRAVQLGAPSHHINEGRQPPRNNQMYRYTMRQVMQIDQQYLGKWTALLIVYANLAHCCVVAWLPLLHDQIWPTRPPIRMLHDISSAYLVSTGQEN